MSDGHWMEHRSWRLQLGLTLVGVVANSIFNGSWRSLPTLIYDVPASLITFGLISQVLIERIKGGTSPYILYRFVMVLALFALTAGRQFLQWPISGHLSCALAVALVQCGDARLLPLERICYCLPVPIVLYFRWTSGDYNTPTGEADHWQTYNAVLFALAWAIPGILVGRFWKSRKNGHLATQP